MHVENLRTGMWVRIEGLKPYRFSNPEEAYLWSSQVDGARRSLSLYGGLPMQVVACQFPFLLANIEAVGTIMLDLRFVTVGKCDDKFRNVVSKIRAKNRADVHLLMKDQLKKKCDCGQSSSDDGGEWEPIDG